MSFSRHGVLRFGVDSASSLGNYDWRELFDEWNFVDPISADTFKVSQTYSLEDELVERSDELYRSIVDCFSDWINQIDISQASKQMSFDSDSHFLTFNYTSTLEVVYKIHSSRIFHLHGTAKFDDLVFGHGVEIPEEPLFDDNGDSNRSMFTDAEDAAKAPLFMFQKKVCDILAENREYFESLSHLQQVVVMGHSLADVDLPYFQKIVEVNAGCAWTVYYYCDSEVPRMQGQLKKSGLHDSMISMKPYPSCGSSVQGQV